MIAVWKIVKADCTGCGLMPGKAGLLQATRSSAPEFIAVGEVLCKSCQDKRYAIAEAAETATVIDLPLGDDVLARAQAARDTATREGYARLATDVASADLVA